MGFVIMAVPMTHAHTFPSHPPDTEGTRTVRSITKKKQDLKPERTWEQLMVFHRHLAYFVCVCRADRNTL